MTLLEQTIVANAEKYRKIFLDALNEKKEAHTMNALQVSCNGFTGELVKLEGKQTVVTTGAGTIAPRTRYDLSIYDSEKRVTHSFDSVKLEDIKFLGGAVSFE